LNFVKSQFEGLYEDYRSSNLYIHVISAIDSANMERVYNDILHCVDSFLTPSFPLI